MDCEAVQARSGQQDPRVRKVQEEVRDGEGVEA